jgi:putative peptidoglycan lipid II flippase
VSDADRHDRRPLDDLPPPATVAGRRRSAAAERDRQRAALAPPPIGRDDDWLADTDPRARRRPAGPREPGRGEPGGGDRRPPASPKPKRGGRRASRAARRPLPADAGASPHTPADDSATGAAAAAAIGAPEREAVQPAGGGGRRIARNTAIFSIATGLSRIAGLVREIVASSYFATSGAFSAFTIAFQVPNLVRSLVADAALSAAFVPVFTELLEQRRRREAFHLASTLFWVILAGLGAITALFILGAGVVMPLFTPGDKFTPELVHLTVGLSRVLFPIVVLLGLNGLVVGILNAYDHFSVPAIAPLVWNVVIIVALVILRPHFHGQDQLYAYAIGVLLATVVQLGMALPQLGRLGFHLQLTFDWRNPMVRRIFTLMLPVTIGLGVINFDLLINSSLGSLVSEQAPRAIDAAFRIYMLPQGMFSVALATVLFPALSRYAARHDIEGLRRTLGNGMRQIFLMLIPAAAITLVLATPITRLIYQHGSFGSQSTEQVATALFWFSFSLPFSGANLLLTRTFFSLQRPWTPTALAAVNLALNAGVSLALYKPLGIAGLVIGTGVASLGMMLLQAFYLRRELHGRIEATQTLLAVVQITIVSALMGVLSYGLWWGIDHVLGRSLAGQVLSVGTAIAVGLAAYVAAVLALRIPEALQIRQLVAGRLHRSAA